MSDGPYIVTWKMGAGASSAIPFHTKEAALAYARALTERVQSEVRVFGHGNAIPIDGDGASNMP